MTPLVCAEQVVAGTVGFRMNDRSKMLLAIEKDLLICRKCARRWYYADPSQASMSA